MKNVKFSSARIAMLCGVLVAAGLIGAYAQESITTSTTTAGTVSQYSPDAITVTTTPSALPVSYSFAKTTTYVDENGNPVSVETIRSGVPVTVFYSREGDRLLASKVVVRQASIPTDSSATIIKKSTTTTTTTTPAP